MKTLRTCEVQDCGRQAEYGRRVCSRHRYRLRKGLDLHDDSRQASLDAIRDFWRSLMPDMGPQCVEYPGSRSAGGYGRVLRHGEVIASRATWVELFGPIPAGQCVLHRCDNPPCCNPAHLFLGTLAENSQDRNAKGRQARLYGERNGQARLTDAEVAEIRSAIAAGELTGQVARRFGVHRGHVWNLVRGNRRPIRDDLKARVK